MNDQKSSSTFAERYSEWVVRHRWLVLAVSLVIGILAASGVTRLGFIDEYRVFFGPDNPQLLAFDEVEAIYTKNDNILVVVETPDNDAFSNKTLEVVEEIAAEAWKIPFAIRVESLTNFQHTYAEGEDDLIVEDLVTEASGLSSEQLAEKKVVALNEPQLLNRMVTHDADVVGINVTLQLPRKEADETARSVAFARELGSRIEAENPGFKVRMTGMVMLNNAFQESAMKDMATLIPLMYVVIIVVMAVLLRSVSGTFATVSVIGLSVTSGLGLAGWAGLSLTPPSTASITMIMTLAVADSIHVLVSMIQEMRRGRSKREAITESLRINSNPVFLTSITTVIGFLSMNFSEVPPLRDLGNIAATGVAAAWFYSMTFLPAVISILPVKVKKRAEEATPSLVDSMAEFVIRKRKVLLAGGAVTALLLVGMLPLNDLNDQFVDYFDHSMAFRQDSDFAMEKLSGIYQIHYSLGAGESSGISEPSYIEKVEEFAEWYRQQPGVVHVFTISDVFKRLNKNMHADAAEYYRIPAGRELAAQYLLLFEMSLPYGLDLNDTINVDKSATRLMVTTENVKSKHLINLVESGERWLQENAPAHMFARGVGPGVMFSYISARNIRSMLIGTLLAIGLIGFTLIAALRSVKYGLLSFLPNLIPGAMAFGLWGGLVGEVNLGLSIVSGMCIGIVVDDTVHFLSKYIRAKREHGLCCEDAVRYAFKRVGAALIVTSVVLAAGFIVLAQSTFGLNGDMGKMAAIIVVIALSADLLLLPPLLMRVEGGEAQTSEEKVKDIEPAVA